MARGGARAGAGRRKSAVKLAPRADKCVASAVLSRIDEVQAWLDLIEYTAPNKVDLMGTPRGTDGVIVPLTTKESAALLTVHFQALRYMKDCRDGKPKQAVTLSGEVTLNGLADRLQKARERGKSGAQ